MAMEEKEKEKGEPIFKIRPFFYGASKTTAQQTEPTPEPSKVEAPKEPTSMPSPVPKVFPPYSPRERTKNVEGFIDK